MSHSTSQLPVVVIGGGPVGLAAAAHLMQRGLRPRVLEAGDGPAANLEGYRHVRLFSPWRYDIDRAARSLLEAEGWREPDLDALPTAGEIVHRYLLPLARLPAMAPNIRYGSRVTQLTRAGFDKVKTSGRERAPFVVRYLSGGEEHEILASAVIDAAGTWNQPNPLGANGLPGLGESANAAHIAYGMPDFLGRDRARYAGKRVLVVGAGHSAAGNLIALAELAQMEPGTRLAWAIRGSNFVRIFGGGDADGLPARGALGQRLKALKEAGRLELHEDFRIREVRSKGGTVEVIGEGGKTIAGVDEIVAATGARPNLAIASELRVKLDPWLESTELLAPLIDPSEHSCGTVRPHGHRELAHPEPGYYAVGAKSYGRAPNFLMATGYEQVRSVVAALAGDTQAADDVQLELPQTGVCSASFPSAKGADTAAGCCGGPAIADSTACCAEDESAKAKGEAGCGCGAAPVPLKLPEPGSAKGCCGPAKATQGEAVTRRACR